MEFSIIIPTLNNAKKLDLCLQHLMRLKFASAQYEILVIDNNSVDSTVEVVEKWKKEIMCLKLCICKKVGLMSARHMGYEVSTGDILCFIDDDSFVDPLWLDGISETFRMDKDVVMVGGPCIPLYETELPEWCEKFWKENQYGRSNSFLSLVDFGQTKTEISPSFIYGCNYIIAKKIFREIGGTLPDYLPQKYKYYMGSGETGVGIFIGKYGKVIYNPKILIHHFITKDRLLPLYYFKRSEFNGIGVSYNLTRDYLLSNISYFTYFVKRCKVVLVVIKDIVLNEYLNKTNVKHIKRGTLIWKLKGFILHQFQVRSNRNLRKWISLKNYLDGRDDVENFIENNTTNKL